MFENITREHFRIDTVLPAAQVAAATIGSEALGRFGHFTVSSRATLPISAAAALITAIASNFFTDKLYQYLSIPLSVTASFVLLSGKGINIAGNIKEIVILSAILALVKAVFENIHRLTAAGEKAVKSADEAVKKGEKKAEAAVDAIAKTEPAKVDEKK